MAYRVMQVWWFLRRPHTRGVKLVLRRGDEVLFVRHTYGSRREWELPGGGIRRGETAHQAARRESQEELGLSIDTWRLVGEQAFKARATAHLSCLTAAYDGAPVRLDLNEIDAYRWSPRISPPTPLGDHATAFLELPALSDETWESDRP